MTKTHAYNLEQRARGTFTDDHLEKLVRHWQSTHGLAVDGMAGPKTLASLVANDNRPQIHPLGEDWIWPLRRLDDGRKPVITSGYKDDNPSRPNHNGVDIFWPWQAGDPDPGKTRRVLSGRKRKWWIPAGAVAVAVKDGRCNDVRPNHKTGGLVWLDVGDYKVGYMHLEKVLVSKHQDVKQGDPIGIIGGNPATKDALAHLHFEVAQIGPRYHPLNVSKWLKNARHS